MNEQAGDPGNTAYSLALARMGAEELLPLEPGERLWKVFIFRPHSGRSTRLEHRIFCKERPDGSLALVTYAVHTPSGGRPVRSNVVRVPRLTQDELHRIVTAIRQQEEQAGDDEEIDLTTLSSLDEQILTLEARLSGE